jgi:TonB-dependent SusC/RagA subfamily outer membrane receptor
LRAAVLVLALVAPLGAATAQEPTHVVGQVRDSSTLKPIAGVRVTVVGTALGTATDANGRYALDIPPGRDSLSFRRIGYGPVVRRVGPVVDVAMRLQAMELEAVPVTTALGIEREGRTLSYSAQTVSGDQLTGVPKENVLSALQGNVAGIQVTNSSNPFGSARIVARGAGSILGENQPLIVVDGIPIDNSAATNNGYFDPVRNSMVGYDIGNGAADIDANNIESVTVLPGPNAAALYGSRAANGAIVITTKKGQGASENGFGVTGTFGTTFEKPLRLPDYQNQYGQGFYGEFEFVDGNGGGKNDEADESWGPKLDGRTTGCVFKTDSAGKAIVGTYDTSRNSP